MSAGVGEEVVLSSELGTRDLAQYAEYTDYNSEGQVSMYLILYFIHEKYLTCIKNI